MTPCFIAQGSKMEFLTRGPVGAIPRGVSISGATMAQCLPAGHAWRKCRRLDRERACLQRRIFPAGGKELTIRPCDVCPVGTNRARALATHARRVDAMIVGAA